MLLRALGMPATLAGGLARLGASALGRLQSDYDAPDYADRGFAWGWKEEYDKAIKDYDGAIRLDPKFSWAYLSRGEARLAEGLRVEGAAGGPEVLVTHASTRDTAARNESRLSSRTSAPRPDFI